MIVSMVLAAALAIPPAPAEVPQAPGTQRVLQIRATGVYPDGNSRGHSGSSDPAGFDSYIYAGTTACTLGGAGTESGALAVPGYGWHVSARVLKQEPNGVFVQIDWQRIWHQSQRISNGISQSFQVVIQTGDKLSLDDIMIPPTAGCAATGVHLEASVSEEIILPPRAKMEGTVVSSSGGGGVSGGIIGAAAGAGTASREALLVTRGGSGALAGFGPGIESIAAPVDVDLFLVVTKANGSEEVKKLTIPASPSSHFTFPAVIVNSSEGAVDVVVGGGLAAVIGVGGEKQLRVVVERTVTGNASVDGKGMSLSAYQMPGPGDVYSFEIPPMRARGEIVSGDHVSLRLRIAARSK